MSINEIIVSIDNFVWGISLIILSLGSGLLFSITLKFPQIRLFKEMVRCSFKNKKGDAGLTPFQALSIAIGGRVGTGNITGTASAILFGGPGAVFWLCVMAIICSMSAYIESALAQVWKEKYNGEYAGGPSFYMNKGLKFKPAGVFYALLSVIFLIIFAGVQTNAFSSVAVASFNISPFIVAVIYTILLVLVIFGGAKAIANVADKVVPFMSISYVAVAILLILINITKVPTMFSLIIRSALSMDAVFGGIVGASISWGVRRGVFSNEAGLGTGAWVAGCADVSHPAKAGLSQAFSIFISLLICIATSLMILITDSYNVVGANGNYIVQNIVGDYDIFTTKSIDSVVSGFGSVFISLAMFLFTFTTIMAYSIYLNNINYFFFGGHTNKKNIKLISILINIAITILAFFGPLVKSSTIWSMASAMCGIISLINLISLILLYKPGIATLKDYERQLKMGIDPVFIPEECGIKDAELWNKIIEEDYSEELANYKKVFKE
ncbi:alanine/glycine:cation symporter family protein [Fusobacterium nucleatum]|uniref:Alanine:cation symporter family protein n=1 Tax=Fusobacterium nucleatum TaxID=851 RepID=A0A323U2S2_FUSNU|nr:alanine/glycine:cation symporter family protein [Fusobacterium nucleatum]PCR84711.1 amino acid carrier protein [Fusobacterium nucleatum]PZA05036.1 alanine:cation symporter family protein [Fusobacterium nucleatum]QJX51540.1 alanine:cation symporter family protein [Fusobacterium nucleatum]BEP00050.1 alanine/glycine:cation symporter family protein [Fusobacterium nucleatum]BEP11450.1 alanine/glycine:cation symporter family protein [Fusobacterium nucleatum]